MYGASVSVCLPFLDCFLDENGAALAATGAPLPVCFGTWWQGLGFNPGRWIPGTVGKGFKNNVELAIFDQFRDKMNVISGTKYNLDGRPLETHTTGWQIASMGTIPTGVNTPASLDQNIADVIGTRTRFRSIEVAIGGGRQSFSKREGSASNPSEPSPTALYARIYGPEFKDPNAADFKPDPMVLARDSVLSAVKDERMSLMKQVGASDRARLEQYFASVRQIEHQLALDMQKPDPLPACTVPADPKETKASADVPDAEKNAKIFGKLLAHAIACGQTRVVNVVLGSQGLHSPGSQQTWHSLTHEEPIDPKLGYQKEVTFFINWANARFADFLKELDTYKEGDHTVLDRIAILWQTDHSYARTHTMDALPIMTAGRASGRLKAGMHISLPGDPATRAGLTMQQIMGVPLKDWGTLSNQTAKTITDLVA
jgi:hypothetical protein